MRIIRFNDALVWTIQNLIIFIKFNENFREMNSNSLSLALLSKFLHPKATTKLTRWILIKESKRTRHYCAIAAIFSAAKFCFTNFRPADHCELFKKRILRKIKIQWFLYWFYKLKTWNKIWMIRLKESINIRGSVPPT